MVEISTTEKLTVAEILEILEKTPQWLIDETMLSPGVVYRTLDDSPVGLKTHITSAEAIVKALGLLGVDEVHWYRGLSNTGRNALSGGTFIERTVVTTTIEHTVTYAKVCPSCYLEIPVAEVCEDCPRDSAAA